MIRTEGFGVEFRTYEQLPTISDRWWDDVLGVAQFGRPPPEAAPLPVPTVTVALSPLAVQPCTCEIWRTPGPMRSGQIGAVRYRATSQLLFGCIVVPESDATANGHSGASPLER